MSYRTIRRRAPTDRNPGSPSPLADGLADLVNRQSFHGSWLPLRTAMADNVAICERAILLAERVGWIERGTYDPLASREFMFFGLGGFTGSKLPTLDPKYRSALCFHWITITTRWLTPEFVQDMLISGGVA